MSEHFYVQVVHIIDYIYYFLYYSLKCFMALHQILCTHHMHTDTHTHKHTHTHSHTHAHVHAHTGSDSNTHIYRHICKAKSLAAVKMTSGTLGYLGTNQVLWVSAGKSTWGRASTLLVGLYHAKGNGVGAQCPTRTTPISRQGQQFDICFISYYQVLTAGWAVSPVGARSPFDGWVNVNKVSCSSKQQYQSVLRRIWTYNLSINRPKAWLLGYAAPHIHIHAHICTHTLTLWHTHECFYTHA